ncbi:hypothetical protein H5410_046260 [Solanum commersonii]|uniref:Uncharacterized protein n=1 Tax=Solanum commersonii TaxID=4109 RepID=A0A9J5XDP3_SOLCO|nr:hypothetical protein H5410_046260 [Solanum commersonii]
MLSIGGKATLVKYVLQSLPIHFITISLLQLSLSKSKVSWPTSFGDGEMIKETQTLVGLQVETNIIGGVLKGKILSKIQPRKQKMGHG